MVDIKEEILFGRPARLKVFVSSKMRRNPLVSERAAVVDAIEGTGFAEAWCWEKNANAGPFCAEAICLGHAGTSDALVLILGSQLTDITEKEYREATNAGAPCFVFTKQTSRFDQGARAFISAERSGGAVTKGFANSSELKTHVTEALLSFSVQSFRREVLRRRRQDAKP